jgi:hypothetical protein
MPPRAERQLRATAIRKLARACYLIGERRYDEVVIALDGLWTTLSLAEQAYEREEDERLKRDRAKVTKRAKTLAEQEERKRVPQQDDQIPF